MNKFNFLEVISKIKAEKRTLMKPIKLITLYTLLNSTDKQISLEYAIAECGVYKGGSLKLIATTCPNRQVYGFDSFEGLGKPLPDEKKFKKGRFKSDLEEVAEYLSDCSNIKLIPGWFPNTTIGLEEIKFAFVHLDMDQYESTIKGLEFFYPRMANNSVILCDDYEHPDAPGIKRAFDEFFDDKQEFPIPVGYRQVFIIKK